MDFSWFELETTVKTHLEASREIIDRCRKQVDELRRVSMVRSLGSLDRISDFRELERNLQEHLFDCGESIHDLEQLQYEMIREMQSVQENIQKLSPFGIMETRPPLNSGLTELEEEETRISRMAEELGEAIASFRRKFERLGQETTAILKYHDWGESKRTAEGMSRGVEF